MSKIWYIYSKLEKSQIEIWFETSIVDWALSHSAAESADTRSLILKDQDGDHDYDDGDDEDDYNDDDDDDYDEDDEEDDDKLTLGRWS